MGTIQPVQIQKCRLAGSGVTSSATSIILQKLQYLDGSDVVTADFADLGFFTIEPGTSKEESCSFTTITQNVDGTATLSGVIRGLGFNYPYTEVAGNKQSHAGGSILVFSNTSAFYANIKSYADAIASAGAADASTTAKGIGKVSYTPVSAVDPIFVGDNDPRVPTQDENDALAGNDGTPSTSNKYVTETGLAAGLLTIVATSGIISPFAGRTAPTGYLMCDGSAVSRTTYASLKAAIAPSKTFTVTKANPAVFTCNTHGLVAGDKVSVTTTGGMYSGLAANTDYFVIATGLTTDAFQLSTSRGGSGLETTGSESGVHTIHYTAYGKGDGSTTFNVPDMRGKIPYGYQSNDANFDALNVPNTYVGEKTHVITEAELATHTHACDVPTSGGEYHSSPYIYAQSISYSNGSHQGTNFIPNIGSNTAHNNIPPYVVTNWIIKT